MPAMFFDRIAQSIAGMARSYIRLFLGVSAYGVASGVAKPGAAA